MSFLKGVTDIFRGDDDDDDVDESGFDEQEKKGRRRKREGEVIPCQKRMIIWKFR